MRRRWKQNLTPFGSTNELDQVNLSHLIPTLQKYCGNTANKPLIAAVIAVNLKMGQKGICNWKLKIEDFSLAVLKDSQLGLSVGMVR